MAWFVDAFKSDWLRGQGTIGLLKLAVSGISGGIIRGLWRCLWLVIIDLVYVCVGLMSAFASVCLSWSFRIASNLHNGFV